MNHLIALLLKTSREEETREESKEEEAALRESKGIDCKQIFFDKLSKREEL